MKIKNPECQQKLEELAESQREEWANYFSSHLNKGHVGFEDLRAAFPDIKDPKTGGPLTDGTIAAMCQHLGYKVVE